MIDVNCICAEFVRDSLKQSFHNILMLLISWPTRKSEKGMASIAGHGENGRRKTVALP
jgi:hypothetical protein